MQKGVLIKEGSDVIEKRVYSGDTSVLDEKLVAEGVQYEIYDDTDSAFVNATIKEVETKEERDWKLLTTVEEKISYIANKLGFE